MLLSTTVYLNKCPIELGEMTMSSHINNISQVPLCQLTSDLSQCLTSVVHLSYLTVPPGFSDSAIAEFIGNFRNCHKFSTDFGLRRVL